MTDTNVRAQLGGLQGPRGLGIHVLDGPPPAGDFYRVGEGALDRNTGLLYGPKTSAGWGTPTSILVGASLLTGAGAPAADLGRVGEPYLDTTNWRIYAAKTLAGWTTSRSLIGWRQTLSAHVVDPTKIVLRIDYFGGDGAAPADNGKYLVSGGAAVADPALATNIRGTDGSLTQAGLDAAAAAVAAAVAAVPAASTATTKAGEASTSAELSQKWAVQTTAEVVGGQGFGAKKYAQDAATSAQAASDNAGAVSIKLGQMRARELPNAAVNPALDENGVAVVDGARFWDTALSRLKIRVAGVWWAAVQRIFTTTGVPLNTFGLDEDYAIDGAAKTIYLKTAGVWGAFATLGGMSLKRIDVFLASGTWTKQTGDVLVRVVCVGPGGGGGSGAHQAVSNASIAGGGPAGAGGSVTEFWANATDLGATVAVTIGAAGVGGAPVTVPGTAGNAGTAGGTVRFGASICGGGGGGAGGPLTTTPANTSGVYGASVGDQDQNSHIINFNRGNGGLGNQWPSSPGTTGGGVGQHIQSGALYGAAAGSRSGTASFGSYASAAAVLAFGGAGSAGSILYGGRGAGSGGGGGAGSIGGSAQAGGMGGAKGGGGGGGGACFNGVTSGAGGDGGPGACWVWTYG